MVGHEGLTSAHLRSDQNWPTNEPNKDYHFSSPA